MRTADKKNKKRSRYRVYLEPGVGNVWFVNQKSGALIRMRPVVRIASAVLALFLSGACMSGLQASSVQVMDDFNFGTWSPLMSRWTQVVPVCVWDENARKTTFRVNVSGVNSNNSFQLENDINDQIPYRVNWRNNRGTNRRERLMANVDSQSVYRIRDNFRCENGPSGYLQITINNQNLRNAPPGIYTDTVIVMISPL